MIHSTGSILLALAGICIRFLVHFQPLLFMRFFIAAQSSSSPSPSHSVEPNTHTRAAHMYTFIFLFSHPSENIQWAVPTALLRDDRGGWQKNILMIIIIIIIIRTEDEAHPLDLLGWIKYNTLPFTQFPPEILWPTN